MCNSPKADTEQARHKTLAITGWSLCYEHFAILPCQSVRETRLKLLNGDFLFTKSFIVACLHFLLASAAVKRLSALSTAPIPDAAQQKVQRRNLRGASWHAAAFQTPLNLSDSRVRW